MASLSKFGGALVAATQENKLALAHAELHVSLLKIEAPVEYRGLGKVLSNMRRGKAEDGSTHETAAKLGTLFKGILPETPRLFETYGIRATEIAKDPRFNSKDRGRYGAFAEYYGIDGTSIWAAATSGDAAIAVHLLACMLARMWDATQAVAIWDEMVETRKSLLDANLVESQIMSTVDVGITHIRLSRRQLAEWDASARAWLGAADRVNVEKQDQLRLILHNIHMPVSSNMEVYKSVVFAWGEAMKMMNGLIDGGSCIVKDGAVLLGLSSWHLYPDMIVLGHEKIIRQNDPLLRGQVTLDLQGNGPNSRGVYWSLPLAHVHYYDDPVVSDRSLDSTPPRISIEDLWQIILGSLVKAWGFKESDTARALEIIAIMSQKYQDGLPLVKSSKLKAFLRGKFWLGYLGDAARQIIHSEANETSLCRRLFLLGARRCKLFEKWVHNVPMLGLGCGTLVSILKADQKLRYLRNIAPRYQKEGDRLVIMIFSFAEGSIEGLQITTAFAQDQPASTLRSNRIRSRHKNWIFNSNASSQLRKVGSYPSIIDDEEYNSLDPSSIVLFATGRYFLWADPPSEFTGGHAVSPNRIFSSHIHMVRHGNRYRFDPNGKPPKAPESAFDLVVGDRYSALFRMRNRKGDTDSSAAHDEWTRKHESEYALQQVGAAFKSDIVDPSAWVKYMYLGHGDFYPEIGQEVNVLKVHEALQAMEVVSDLYSQMPGATVNLDIIKLESIVLAKWAKGRLAQSPDNIAPFLRYRVVQPYSLSLAATFACIAMFESGSFNIEPYDLQTVMAVSAGESLFVAAPLLCDPGTRPRPMVHRIFGNIGQAGIAFLIPPGNPKVKTFGLESFQVVNFEPYNDKLEDCFQGTSLHLEFSGYELPLGVGNHGGRNRDAFFVESLLRVRDHGGWVADLDVLKALRDSQIYISDAAFQALQQSPTADDETECQCRGLRLKDRGPPDHELVSIDSWEELLENDRSAAVVRAHGNWAARLAATAVSVQMGKHTVVSSVKGFVECHECLNLPCGDLDVTYII